MKKIGVVYILIIMIFKTQNFRTMISGYM